VEGRSKQERAGRCSTAAGLVYYQSTRVLFAPPNPNSPGSAVGTAMDRHGFDLSAYLHFRQFDMEESCRDLVAFLIPGDENHPAQIWQEHMCE
jgi:hypothetical protein